MGPMITELLSLVLTGFLPAPHFTAYFTPAFTDAAYQKEAVAKIQKAWKPVSGAPAGKKTVLIAEIAEVERWEQQATEHVQRLADDLAHLVSNRGMLVVRPVL